MEAVANLVKITLPHYLKSLPVPSSFEGFSKLNGDDWLRLLPFMLTVTLILYSIVKLILPSGDGRRKTVVNQDIKKDSPKVVDLVDIEDMDKDKVSYCRCWRSKKFPLCDGTHNDHNDETGDNVGPLVLKRKPKTT